MNRRHLLLTLTAVAAGSLAACSGPYTMAADVSSYGQWPAGRSGGSYAFERLPSQQQSQRQNDLEQAAAAALAKAGLTPAADPKTADVLVSIGARVSPQERAPWDDPLWWRWHGGIGYWRHGGYWRPMPFGAMGGPMDRRYEREVAVLLRDRQSSEPLYEAHASNDGASMGDPALMKALFEAALSDFPRAVPESHRVTVQATR